MLLLFAIIILAPNSKIEIVSLNETMPETVVRPAK